MRKVAWRIVPFVMLLYFVAFIDRVNIGFAALTMNRDIGLSQSAFGFGAGLFFVGYFLCEVPSNVALRKVGARIWIARVMLTWGAVSGCMALVTGPVSFYVLRFLLGAAEAGFFPGIILYLSDWFPSRGRARITALFMAAAPLSTAIGSPLTGALLRLDGVWGLAGWKWMFVAEAAPAVLLGFAVLVWLTDEPRQAAWLAPEEREWLAAEMDAEHAEKDGGSAGASVWQGLRDRRVLALSLVYFGTSAGLYTIGVWSPQIIDRAGLPPLELGLLNAIPAAAAVAAMFLWARHSDRTGERTWHVVLACGCAITGLVAAAFAESLLAVVAALTLVSVGIGAAKPPLWSLPTAFLSGSAAASGIAAINSIGNLGGFAGPAMIGWLHDRTGGFAAGLLFVAALVGVSAATTLLTAGDHANRVDAGAAPPREA